MSTKLKIFSKLLPGLMLSAFLLSPSVSSAQLADCSVETPARTSCAMSYEFVAAGPNVPSAMAQALGKMNHAARRACIVQTGTRHVRVLITDLEASLTGENTDGRGRKRQLVAASGSGRCTVLRR